MSLDRALLVGGPAKLTFNSATFHSKEDIKPKFMVDWKEVDTSLFGLIDKSATDARIVTPVRLWGAWENLTTLFPSALLAPTYIGTRINTSVDTANSLVLHSTNTDRYTFPNSVLTKLPNLHLGLDDSIFAADAEFTSLIANTKNPEDAGAYYTQDTAAYTDTTFAKTNYKQQRYSSAWSGITGFTSFQTRDGWDIEWDLKLEPDHVDGLGTVGFIFLGLVVRAKCIPVEPTSGNLLAAARFQGFALGRLLSTGSADLVITGSGVSVTLKNAGLTESALAFGGKPLRNGELVWETTVGFTTGAPAARAVVA